MSSQEIHIRSHRRLINEKTNQLVPYHRLAPKKSTKSFKKKTQITQIDKQLNHDHDTSIVIDICQKEISSKQNISILYGQYSQQFKSDQCLVKPPNRKRNKLEKVRSEKNLLRPQNSISKQHKTQFSIRKKRNNYSSCEKSKNGLSQNSIEERLQQENKGASKARKSINQFNPNKISSENKLRGTLKKTSALKLKLKIKKDPFQRKMKLQNQFKNQSDVFAPADQSLLSTVNRQQFKQILSLLDL